MLSDMYRYLIDIIYKKRYDYIFFLPIKLTYAETGVEQIATDGTRYQSAEELDILDQHMTLLFTKIFKADNIYKLDCTLDERLTKVLDIIGA